MKRYSLLILSLLLSLQLSAQETSGKITTRILESQALQNPGGENPKRKISVYPKLFNDYLTFE